MTTVESLLSSILEKVFNLDVMAGANGTRVYGGVGANTGLNAKALTIREDATGFTSLSMTNGTTVLTHTYFIVGGAGLLKGDYLAAPRGYTITAFQLSAGSVGVSDR